MRDQMTKTNINIRAKQILYGIIAIALTLAYFPNIASASQITARKVAIGSSTPSAYTTYNFTFTVPQTTTIKSVGFAACTTASGACTPATGFDSATSTLASSSNLGSGGSWTVNTSTATELRMLNASNTGAPSAGITANFANVRNPSAPNSTFFMRITTFSDSAWTTAIDTGVVATSTAGQITITASVDETLTFTLAAATVGLGTLTTSSTGTGISSMTVGTNGATGYSIGYAGNTLTSGSNTITPMAAAAGSTQNSKQFGINLMANTTPPIGSNKSGTGSGIVPVASGYDVANSFKFNVAGDLVATATVPTNTNTFTTSYIANIDAITAAGAYSTILTYTATANF
jgi:hypothetical protein